MAVNKLSIATLNVAGIRGNNEKLNSIFQLTKNYHILCLQETNLISDQFVEQFNRCFITNFEIFHSKTIPEDSKAGIVILINRNLPVAIDNKWVLLQSRAISLTLQFEKLKIGILGVYGQASREHREDFYRRLYEALPNSLTACDEIVMLGDFNIVELPLLDRSVINVTNMRPDGRPEFKRLTNFLGLHDAFREKYPTRKYFTYLSATYNTFARLDRIYLTGRITAKQLFFSKKCFTKSDHDLVIVEFDLDGIQQRKGKGYWKLKPDDLEHEDSRQGMRVLMNDYENNFYNEKERWENFKLKVANLFITVSRIKKKEQSQLYRQISQNLERARADLAMLNSNENIRNLNICKKEMKTFEYNLIGQILTTTHYKNVATDTVSLQSAKALQKKSAEGRTIFAIKNDLGEILYKTEEILEEIKNQYENLFESKNITQGAIDFFLESENPSLTNVQNLNLNLPISRNEIEEAILDFEKKKTPGDDGLTVEFYLKFLPFLSEKLEKVYQKCFETGELCKEMYFGVIFTFV